MENILENYMGSYESTDDFAGNTESTDKDEAAEAAEAIEKEYAELVGMYSDMVTRLCILHSTSMWDAEDCYQNTFLKLYEALPKGYIDEPKAWLIRVCLNECKSLMRKRLRFSAMSLEETEIVTEDKSSLETLDAVFSLAPKYRDVIYLHYFEEMQVSEIAEAIGENENTVKTRLRRARQKLRDIL